MRPPPSICENLALTADGIKELLLALGNKCSPAEKMEIERLGERGLPPVTSVSALSVMTGYHPNFLWSLTHRTNKHYRTFKIPKGRSVRKIEAPRVGLKFIQRWLAIHFERAWKPSTAVHGFVKRRSHLSAAEEHLGAKWLVSVDIENFFQSTNVQVVQDALRRMGYEAEGSVKILSQICCLNKRLPQGAPTSPTISNVALHEVDSKVLNFARNHGWKYTRYADDLVLSGTGTPPNRATEELEKFFEKTCWVLSQKKSLEVKLPHRLKVHGLLVHGDKLRLTKQYRNKIRTYRHLQKHGKISEQDANRLMGHIHYADQVERFHSRD